MNKKKNLNTLFMKRRCASHRIKFESVVSHYNDIASADKQLSHSLLLSNRIDDMRHAFVFRCEKMLMISD